MITEAQRHTLKIMDEPMVAYHLNPTAGAVFGAERTEDGWREFYIEVDGSVKYRIWSKDVA